MLVALGTSHRSRVEDHTSLRGFAQNCCSRDPRIQHWRRQQSHRLATVTGRLHWNSLVCGHEDCEPRLPAGSGSKSSGHSPLSTRTFGGHYIPHSAGLAEAVLPLGPWAQSLDRLRADCAPSYFLEWRQHPCFECSHSRSCWQASGTASSRGSPVLELSFC